MLASERHAQICELLKKNGVVTTADLTALFSVSVETIRRDLLLLEQSHKLQRVHGGAMQYGEVKAHKELPFRLAENQSAKRELAITAASLVEEGDIIAVDAGSTATFFAEVIKERFSSLTVITHSLAVFEALNGHKNFHLILCGGEFYPPERAFSGVFTMDMLRRLHADKTFLFPLAVSLRHGICDANTPLQPIQQLLIACGAQVFILADSSKFEKRALLRISDMRPAYHYVTDSGLSPELKKFYLENHITITTGKEGLK